MCLNGIAEEGWRVNHYVGIILKASKKLLVDGYWFRVTNDQQLITRKNADRNEGFTRERIEVGKILDFV